MEAPDVADTIREVVEQDRTERRAVEQFRSRAALTIAVMAMLLAIASLGGANATKEMINANIHASDTWAFFQAKNIRRTVNLLAADELEILLLVHGSAISEAVRQDAQRKISTYRATAARYESEPDPKDPASPLKGDGMKQLMARARDWEATRDHAQAQDPSFDLSTALFQIAIVLGSVSIVATSRGILITALAVGAVAVLLMFNAFFLLVHLPTGG